MSAWMYVFWMALAFAAITALRHALGEGDLDWLWFLCGGGFACLGILLMRPPEDNE